MKTMNLQNFQFRIKRYIFLFFLLIKTYPVREIRIDTFNLIPIKKPLKFLIQKQSIKVPLTDYLKSFYGKYKDLTYTEMYKRFLLETEVSICYKIFRKELKIIKCEKENPYEGRKGVPKKLNPTIIKFLKKNPDLSERKMVKKLPTETGFSLSRTTIRKYIKEINHLIPEIKK